MTSRDGEIIDLPSTGGVTLHRSDVATRRGHQPPAQLADGALIVCENLSRSTSRRPGVVPCGLTLSSSRASHSVFGDSGSGKAAMSILGAWTSSRPGGRRSGHILSEMGSGSERGIGARARLRLAADRREPLPT